MLAPLNQISPEAMGTVPTMVFSVVLLPAPLEPIRVTISPWSTSKEMPFTALMLP